MDVQLLLWEAERHRDAVRTRTPPVVVEAGTGAGFWLGAIAVVMATGALVGSILGLLSRPSAPKAAEPEPEAPSEEELPQAA